MSTDLVAGLASDLFTRHCAPEVVSSAEGTWAPALWAVIEAAGLTKVGLPEELGGSGGDWAEIGAVLRMAGRAAAPIPIAESVLAARLLAFAGLPIPTGALTVASEGTAELVGAGASRELRGVARRVPWAAEATTIVVLARANDDIFVATVAPAACRIERGSNMAREPRDLVTFPGIAPAGVAVLGRDAAESVRLAGALSRVLLITGALDRILELTCDYAGVREQFGRPIARFQAIQHSLAALAGEVAAAGAAADSAVDAAEAAARAGRGLDACLDEVATAKVRAGMAGTEVSRLAHQIHGAIGVTSEHRLHHFTSRLWSWRDEFGGEREWAIRLGRSVAGSGRAYWERMAGPTAGS